jgi:hypothetical protein
MGKYPYKIYFKDTTMENILDRLQKDYIVQIPKTMSKSIGWKIKPIRKDIRITRDTPFDNQTFLIKLPYIQMEKKKNYYIIKKKY